MTFSLLFCFFKGHITITNYLLNYFPGLDIEKRNAFGFTALMKSAMQGRTECVKALMMAGMQRAFLLLCHHLTTTKKKKWLLGMLLCLHTLYCGTAFPGNGGSFEISHSQGSEGMYCRSIQFACTNSPRSSPRALRMRLIVSRRVWGAG